MDSASIIVGIDIELPGSKLITALYGWKENVQQTAVTINAASRPSLGRHTFSFSEIGHCFRIPKYQNNNNDDNYEDS